MKNIQLIYASIIPLCCFASSTFAASGSISSSINTHLDNNYSEQKILLAGSKGSGRIGRSGSNFSRGRISSSRGGHLGRYNTRRFYGGYGGLGGYGFYGSRFYGPGFYDGFYEYGGYGGYGYHRYNHGAYYPPAVVIPSTPPVYIEKEPEQPVQSTQASQEASDYWHYCRKPEGYYPYVRKCEGEWLKVPPRPAQ